MQNQARPPPDGPLASTPSIFKNGSTILRFLSSAARRSFSFIGVGTAAEMRTREKTDASADSTDCRCAMAAFLAAAVAVVLVAESEPDDEVEVSDRGFRRKLPAEMNAAAEAGVGGWECCWVSVWLCDWVESVVDSDDLWCLLRVLADEDCGGIVVDGTGVTSLAIRASMNVTKVKETLCAGEFARFSSTQACHSSQD